MSKIVHCKKCKWFYEHRGGQETFTECHHPMHTNLFCNPDASCKDAEKKEKKVAMYEYEGRPNNANRNK